MWEAIEVNVASDYVVMAIFRNEKHPRAGLVSSKNGNRTVHNRCDLGCVIIGWPSISGRAVVAAPRTFPAANVRIVEIFGDILFRPGVSCTALIPRRLARSMSTPFNINVDCAALCGRCYGKSSFENTSTL